MRWDEMTDKEKESYMRMQDGLYGQYSPRRKIQEPKSEWCGNCLFWEHINMAFGFCVHDLEGKPSTSQYDRCENYKPCKVREEK